MLTSIAVVPMDAFAAFDDAEETVIIFDFTAFEDTGEKINDFIEIAPFWSNIETMWAMLSFNNSGRGNLEGFVIGNPGTTNITVTASLDRINANGTTTRIADFTTPHSNSRIWAWERPHFVARGHYYRLTLNATVTRNGIRESASISVVAWAN